MDTNTHFSAYNWEIDRWIDRDRGQTRKRDPAIVIVIMFVCVRLMPKVYCWICCWFLFRFPLLLALGFSFFSLVIIVVGAVVDWTFSRVFADTLDSSRVSSVVSRVFFSASLCLRPYFDRLANLDSDFVTENECFVTNVILHTHTHTHKSTRLCLQPRNTYNSYKSKLQRKAQMGCQCHEQHKYSFYNRLALFVSFSIFASFALYLNKYNKINSKRLTYSTS